MKYAPGRRIVVGVATEPGRALLSVKDEGPGIAPEDQAQPRNLPFLPA
jgi:signal transduction histidine kinase